MDSTLTELRVMLPASLIEALRAKAETDNEALDSLVMEAVEDYLHDIEDLPDDVIYARIREGVAQAKRGKVVAAHEALDAIEREFTDEQN